jgi:hypothetical protein
MGEEFGEVTADFKERKRDCFPRQDAWYGEICLGSVNRNAETKH